MSGHFHVLYAVYAVVLAVRLFFAIFLLRQMHTTHTSAYKGGRKRA